MTAVDLRPASPLRRLSATRTAPSETIVDRARIVLTAGVKIPKVRKVQRYLVEETRPELVAAIIPGVIRPGEQVVAPKKLTRFEIVVGPTRADVAVIDASHEPEIIHLESRADRLRGRGE